MGFQHFLMIILLINVITSWGRHNITILMIMESLFHYQKNHTWKEFAFENCKNCDFHTNSENNFDLFEIPQIHFINRFSIIQTFHKMNQEIVILDLDQGKCGWTKSKKVRFYNTWIFCVRLCKLFYKLWCLIGFVILITLQGYIFLSKNHTSKDLFWKINKTAIFRSILKINFTFLRNFWHRAFGIHQNTLQTGSP